jgi:hypothetical protein
MRLWISEFRQWGFRRLSVRYWQCERRYGLPAAAYLSVFSHASERDLAEGDGERERVDMSAFHVTFCLGMDRAHFYFHEVDEGVWEPGGHTSGAEIRRCCKDPAELGAVADRVAAEFLATVQMTLLARES